MEPAAGGAERRWVVVLPVKPISRAKSRLAVPAEIRPRLVLAMALDTAESAGRSPVVELVCAVCDDDVATSALAALGVTVFPDEPAAGLDAALQHGALAAGQLRPGAGVAALTADLPALRTTELTAALTAAAEHPRAVACDAAGEGTTLLTARAVRLAPAFGPGSFARHVAAGAVPLPVPASSGLGRDVDTVDDLFAAERLGVAGRTSEMLHELRGEQTRAGTLQTWQESGGSVLLDDGRTVAFGPAAFRRSGLRFLRPGQRVHLGISPQGDVVSVGIPTLK
jgi:2-phospho-L-lactate guanylyltransferase